MAKDSGPELGATTPISERDLEKLRRFRWQKNPQLTMLLYPRDGIRVVPLVEGDSVIIGRSPLADVCLPDPSLSRQHACVELVNQDVFVEDLDSTNGTWVEGSRIERSKIAAGMQVVLGAVPLSIQPFVSGEKRGVGLPSHADFQVALEAEVQRARTYGRKVALAMIRGLKGPEGHVSRWFSSAQQIIRPFDQSAVYSSDTAEFLLPEADHELVSLFAAKLMEKAPTKLRCGVALFPDDAASSAQLLELSLAALHKATESRPVIRYPEGAPPSEPMLESGEDGMVGPRSEAMVSLFKSVEKVAKGAIPVLIYGETGSGKEVLARWIHEHSKRKEKPMVSVNCGALPPELLTSTLFGHEKGAFTGAAKMTRGLFETADHSTILLDEVGELIPAAQAALLRAIETKRIVRVGSSVEIEVDVRVLAATNQDLESMCQKDLFRWDLFYRLNAITLKVPPLRDRLEEMEPLVKRFIERANQANETRIKGITKEAVELLRRYRWPGNVRELKNVIERAVVIARSDVLTIEDLPDRIRGVGRISRTHLDALETELPGDKAADADFKVEMHRHEADLILRALRASGWDRKAAAERLKLPLRTFAYKMSLHGIKRRSYQRDGQQEPEEDETE